MQALSTAAPGKVYTIKWMFGLPEVLNIIRNCQIQEGSAKLQYICAGGFGVSRKYRTGWNLSDTWQKSYLFRDRSISDMDSLSDRETIRWQLFVRNASGICICGNVCICNGQNE